MIDVKAWMALMCVIDVVVIILCGCATLRTAQVDRRTGQNQRRWNYALLVFLLIVFEGHLELFLKST